MGKNKLGLRIGDTYLGSLGFQAALESKLVWTIAVTRDEDPLHWLTPFSNKAGWSILHCRNADKGQSASLKIGVKAAAALKAKAVAVLLADQPFVTSRMINHLLDEYRDPYTAAANNGVPMPPLVLSQKLFPQLLELNGDTGARALLQTERYRGVLVEADARVFTDIDTPEDYQNLLKVKGKWI